MVDPTTAPKAATESTHAQAPHALPLLTITYYTDPLCSWSWAFEPQWRRLRYELGTQVQWTYRMGGMIADWHKYSDPLNDISRPVQMGPQWYQVRTLSGMPLNERIWFADAPTSSYPACIAVKAAEQQGRYAGERYLRRLREAVMVEERNIARAAVLQEVAVELADQHSEFDAAQFARDVDDPAVLDGFREDVKEVRWREIGRFPTLILRNREQKAIQIVGYRPYEVLLDAVQHIAPAATVQQNPELIPYTDYWKCLTTRELAEITVETVEATEQMLASFAASGRLQRYKIPQTHQSFWSLPSS
jgi:predicted DsbA family dithiol-disulfide isomerase